MGKTKQICWLCLEIVADDNWEVIEEIRKELLEVILINIDFHVNENAIACKKCLDKLEDCFDFKSICFYVDDYIAPFAQDNIKVDIKTVFRKEIANVDLENVQICRLCMSLIEDNISSYTTDLSALIKKCLPEVNFNAVHEPLICGLCLIKVKRLNIFMEACREVYQRIRKIKCEDVADVLCNGEEMKDSIPSVTCFNSEINTCLKMKKQIRKSTSQGRKHMARCRGANKSFDCQECTFKTDTNDILARHMLKHKDKSEMDMYKCENCECETRVLRTTRKFKCAKCTYETDVKHSLFRQNLKQKTKSKVKIHKCEICKYETRYKYNMPAHMLTHRDPREEKKFKCDKCSYKTNYKGNLLNHNRAYETPVLRTERKFKCKKCAFETLVKHSLLRHNLKHKYESAVECISTSDVSLHLKCEICGHEIRHKYNMARHMMTHCDPRAEKKFKCDRCSYETNFKFHLRQHNMVHEDKSEMKMHKCKKCEYETVHKPRMSRHMLTHCDPRAERKFKCEKCTYETNLPCDLRIHNRIHKDKSEVEMHKCVNCEYETRHKGNMARHIRKHVSGRDPQGERKFKCDKCKYKTDYKGSLSVHNLKHKDKSEVEMMKCDNCKFETKYKNCLMQHMLNKHRAKGQRKF